ncbi:hypothetical protein IJJ36_00330 [Candidatus Saccharibacteria bacterium]|nr:hypothetical protein [Candidatus Saccharibacteria bacterium]
MDYLHKIEENPCQDLYWNIPEQKQGAVGIVGGNSQSFRTPVSAAEIFAAKYPIKTVNLILPDALRTTLPPFDGLIFLPSTDSGSFADDKSLTEAINATDFSLMIGDLSKNSITAKAVRSACQNSEKPLLITRDSADLLATEVTEKTLMNEKLIIFASMAQLQKLFRAVYYPKVLLLSQSLVQVAEALHKFTLSYPISIITFHSGQILVAKNGNVNVVPLEKSGYSPITIWNGELAAKIVALNLYNPDNFLVTTTTALFA